MTKAQGAAPDRAEARPEPGGDGGCAGEGTAQAGVLGTGSHALLTCDTVMLHFFASSSLASSLG